MRLGRSLRRTTRPSRLIAVALAACFAAWPSVGLSQNDWKIGEVVGLREGTCIRVGPGLSFRAHTRVPEDDWAVRVIDGPRQANGKEWYDTSRRDAGDSSGGTGWVDRSQTDMCPVDGEPDPPPGRSDPPPDPGEVGDLLDRLRDWWRTQGSLVKWLVALAILAVLVGSWRTLSAAAFRIVGFLIFGFIIYWIADATREVWESTWTSWVGRDGPDLALLLALLPVVSWVVGRVRRR